MKNTYRYDLDAADLRIILDGLNKAVVTGKDVDRLNRLRRWFNEDYQAAVRADEERVDLAARQLDVFGGNDYQMAMAI